MTDPEVVRVELENGSVSPAGPYGLDITHWGDGFLFLGCSLQMILDPIEANNHPCVPTLATLHSSASHRSTSHSGLITLGDQPVRQEDGMVLAITLLQVERFG
jgi:hypothetical protein